MHTDTKNATRKSVICFKTPRVRFFGLTRRVKNYPTNEIGAFAHVSGAAEVTVKTQLGGAQTQNSLAEHTYVRRRRYTASSVYKRRRLSSFNRTIISSSLELLVLEISMFSCLILTSVCKYLLSSSE